MLSKIQVTQIQMPGYAYDVFAVIYVYVYILKSMLIVVTIATIVSCHNRLKNKW